MEIISTCLLLALGLPFLGAVLVAFAGGRLGTKVGWIALVFPVISTASIMALALGVDLPGRHTVEWSWIPSLGINFSFLVDGLSLFFGLVVSGVGCLVFFYAVHYLSPDSAHPGRFFCYLLVFMAAMLGTVFANNLILMFVFWEMTGLASYLLIGFLHGEEDSRVGARQALLITAATGLVMLAGVVMIFAATGTYEITTLMESGMPAERRGWMTVAMVLLVIGAFGKSAQFPIHFWLPNAMSAPTPVSAYLHSATMVKLGVFLCARIFPLFSGNEYWAHLLAWVPLTTMLLGTLLAFLSHDLKAILAYSTVSQLGFLIAYYGLGSRSGVEYDYLHIFNHVLYKGSLFMVAGAVIHSSGIQDIRQLGGLGRRAPLLAVATLLATASMAGLPGTTGFLSKEMMLKKIFEAMQTHALLGWYAVAVVVLASILKVAFSIRLLTGIFLGTEPARLARSFHVPSLALQTPPLILAAASLLFGLVPGLIAAPFRALAVPGLNRPTELALWHGFNKEVLVSSVIVLLGAGLYFAVRPRWRGLGVPRFLQFDALFEMAMERFLWFAKWLTRFLRSDQPVDYTPVVLGSMLVMVGGTLGWQMASDSAVRGLFTQARWTGPDPLRSFTAGLIALSVITVVLLRRWTAQLISLTVAGFLLCFYFVLYRAPDLALTQILVEVVTLFMILILLGRFPRSAEMGERVYRAPAWRKRLNLGISCGVGLTMTAAAWMAGSAPSAEKAGQFFLEQTVPLAKGHNAVNTILVDFRGFDTLGEIAVLFIAMLGCLGLLMRYKRSPEEYEQQEMGPPGFGTGETGEEGR